MVKKNSLKLFMLLFIHRSTLYKAVRGELPDPDVLKVAEVYADFPAMLAPLITTMAISPDVPLVQSALGQVQGGKSHRNAASGNPH